MSDVLSAIAIVVAVVSFVISQHTQKRQDAISRSQTSQGLLLQLRAAYPRISSLAKHPNGPELESALAVATNLVRRLRREADGADFFFIGDTYRHDNFPEQAVPLYREAIARLAQPAPKIAALRGLGYAEALLENPAAAETAMSQAAVVNATANYPQIVKFQNQANTLRVWVVVSETDHNCHGVLQHAREYLSVILHLSSPNWKQAPEYVDQVKEAMAACQRGATGRRAHARARPRGK